MRHFVSINQGKIFNAGLHKSTDITDWAILEYLSENAVINYSNLMADLPMAKLRTKSSVSHRISKLVKLRLIERRVYSDLEAYEELCVGHDSGCLFCGSSGPIERHHYPVRTKDNGSETINLCATCHRLFHFMTDNGLFIVSNEVKSILSGDKA
jgi:hypothetical protein